MMHSLPGMLAHSRAQRLYAFLAGAILLGCGVFANQLNDPGEKPFSLKVPVELVVVPVTVEDGDGNLIWALQKEDFELLENEIPQNITYFSSDPLPLSVAILFDRSTENGTQTALKETVLSLIESFSSFDEMALFQFESTTDKVQDFTSNKDDVLKAFQKISLKAASPGFSGGPLGGSGGQFSGETTLNGIPLDTGQGKVQPPKTLNTHIHDAVFTAAQELRRRNRDRRGIIVLISNGQNAPGNRNSFDATMEVLTQRGITVFAIAQGTSLISRKINLLSKYANPTGGAVFYPIKAAGFTESYQKIAQMARNKYMLGYLPNGRVKTLTFQKITVRVGNKDIKVGKIRSRNGYYALPH